MSRLLCCRRHRGRDMGAALSLDHAQEGDGCDGAGAPAAPPTMADVIRERKKKAGGAGLGTLRRRLAAAARRPRDRPDRGCEHARFIRSVVSSWRLAEVFLLCEELEAGCALRDLVTQAELAREPAPALHAALHAQVQDRRWCDVELAGAGWVLPAHRALLAARCSYFRDLLHHYPSGPCRVPLEGAMAELPRGEVEALVGALYAGPHALHTGDTTAHDPHCERAFSPGGHLDIINVETSGSCSCSLGSASSVRRLAERLGARLDELHRDMRYLLDSGEYSDARLVFAAEGGAAFGFRALELPVHRVVLAARSRFFRSVMSRRAGGAVCVDEKVLPRRFARALLHAAYTDQVDLTLIGRASNSPNNTISSAAAWAGVGRGARAAGGAALEDAFQLYEIARFLEMPIVAQGCEDAVLAALCADSLPQVLRWTATPVASQWVHRQAMRYLRDEFPTVMAHAAATRLPRAALAAALASPFTQCSEAQALRALLRLAERAKQAGAGAGAGAGAEPALAWGGGGGGGGGGSRRRRSLPDAALGGALGALAAHVRTEHLGAAPQAPPLHQAIRRGIVAAPAPAAEGARAADAWLGRGAYRPPRYFLPYLDELKALLEEQAVPEAEVARIRRSRYLHRIPDTLYMVAAERNSGASTSTAPASCAAESACVSPRVLAALRARVRELRAAPPAARALSLQASDRRACNLQIALRAVRELSLPDSCAELLLAEPEPEPEPEPDDSDRERGWESPRADREWPDPDCCRAGGSLRCASAGSGSGSGSLRARAAACAGAGTQERAGTCRRETSRLDAAQHRRWEALDGLSAAVPDVAMAPNGNTHLLTARDLHKEYGVLQLDLGDGATHTPRPGSRAARAGRPPPRDVSQSSSRARPDEDELRAAIELSVMRAYSSFGCRARVPPGAAPPVPSAPQPSGSRSRGSPSPSNSAHLSAPAPAPRQDPAPPADVALSALHQAHHRDPHRSSSAPLAARTPSPRRARPLYRAAHAPHGAHTPHGTHNTHGAHASHSAHPQHQTHDYRDGYGRAGGAGPGGFA